MLLVICNPRIYMYHQSLSKSMRSRSVFSVYHNHGWKFFSHLFPEISVLPSSDPSQRTENEFLNCLTKSRTLSTQSKYLLRPTLAIGSRHTSWNPFGVRGNHSPPSEGPALPPLMPVPFPNRTWPRFINTIRNFFFTHFVIRPYMDNEFDIQEFIRGARQAVAYVSEKLVSGEFDDLEGLVDPNALSQIKMTISSFTVFQRELLKVAVEDIFFSFPYQIGIIIPDPVRQERDARVNRSQSGWVETFPKANVWRGFGLDSSEVKAETPPPRMRPPNNGEGDKILPQTRHVEITVVFHVLRGFSEKAKATQAGRDMQSFQEFINAEDSKYKVMVCNYRFFKDFTVGAQNPTWIINLVNHFLPADHVQIKNE